MHFAHSGKTLRHAFQLILEPVEDQYGTIRLRYDTFQLIHFRIIDMHDRPVGIVRIGIDAAGGQLGQLAGQHARIRRRDILAAGHLQHHGASDLIVFGAGLGGHVNPMVDGQQVGQSGKLVGGPHGQTVGSDTVHDARLGTVQRLPFDALAHSIRVFDPPRLAEILAFEPFHAPPQRTPAVHEHHLRPQVEQVFRGGRAGQPQQPVDRQLAVRRAATAGRMVGTVGATCLQHLEPVGFRIAVSGQLRRRFYPARRDCPVR